MLVLDYRNMLRMSSVGRYRWNRTEKPLGDKWTVKKSVC